MNKDIHGFLTDYKCYVSYVKDCIDDGIEFLTFSEYCEIDEFDVPPKWFAEGMGWE